MGCHVEKVRVGHADLARHAMGATTKHPMAAGWLAGSLEMVVIGRMITGLGATAYPVLVFCSEHVGKRHRSNVMSWCLGVARSLGYR